MTSSPEAWYDAHASRVVPIYEGISPILSCEWLSDLLPKPPALVVDIGSGTGRDAASFAAAGYEVVAVEPSTAMRAEAQKLHDCVLRPA